MSTTTTTITKTTNNLRIAHLTRDSIGAANRSLCLSATYCKLDEPIAIKTIFCWYTFLTPSFETNFFT